MHIIYLHYHLNIYRICSGVIYLISDIDNVCLLSLIFLISLGKGLAVLLAYLKDPLLVSSMLSVGCLFSCLLICVLFIIISFLLFTLGFICFSNFFRWKLRYLKTIFYSGHLYQHPSSLICPFYFLVAQSTTYFPFLFFLVPIYYLAVSYLLPTTWEFSKCLSVIDFWFHPLCSENILCIFQILLYLLILVL